MLRVLCVRCVCGVCVLCVLRARDARRFLDVSADVSGSDGVSDDEEDAHGAGGGGDSASLGSLADFIAEPSAAELEDAGLAFVSSDDEDPTAVLRERRPFARHRRMRQPAPAVPQIGLAGAAAGGAAAAAGLSELAGTATPNFLHLVSGCSDWLPDVSLLFDQERSDALYQQVVKGYNYNNQVVRRAKKDDDIERGSLELTAVTAYCVHILSQRCDLLWSGGAPTPGVQVPGVLMRPHRAHPRVVCEEVQAHGAPLDLATVLTGLVLGHPGNKHWKNLVVGRQLYKSHQLVYLVQSEVRTIADAHRKHATGGPGVVVHSCLLFGYVCCVCVCVCVYMCMSLCVLASCVPLPLVSGCV